MRSIMFRLMARSPGHVDARVYTGPGPERRQLAGELILSRADADALVAGEYSIDVEDQR